MKSISVVFILFAVFALGVLPAMAQEVVPFGTQVIESDPSNQLFQFVVIGLLFILMVALFVLGYSIRQLSQSAPAWSKELIKTMIYQAVDSVELITDATPNVIDDEMLKELKKTIDRILNVDETATDAVTDAVEATPNATA